MRLTNGLKFGFIYCRSTPTDSEIKPINKYFNECNVLMGDFNLSHRIPNDQKKVINLCHEKKVSALSEITRSISNNQLDYILIDELLKLICFVTSFNNFISDHKSITARIGLNENKITSEIKAKLTFDRESHQKARKNGEPVEKLSSTATSDTDTSMTDHSLNSDLEKMSGSDEKVDSSEDMEIPDQNEANKIHSNISIQPFKRKFNNLDLSTCWLNSCLQLLLSGIDHTEIASSFSSELGNELLRLKINREGNILDPTTIKNIIVTTEDTRIATRLSEITSEINDPVQLENQTRVVESLRLNLLRGQQCVRDFFLCLQENFLSWPDVWLSFQFKITHSTSCDSCNHVNQSETSQIYVELPVPPNNSSLNDQLEEYFNTGTLVDKFCEEGCKNFIQADKRSRLTLASETKFIIVILSRAVETHDGFDLVANKIDATNDLFIR